MKIPFVKVNNQQEFDRVVDKMQRETGIVNPYKYDIHYPIISANEDKTNLCGWMSDIDEKIISADEYLTGIRTNFTLSDLEDGMVVELRNYYDKSFFLVLFNKILGLNSYDNLEEYNEDFTTRNSELDIVKIYSIVDIKSLSTNLSKDNLTLIFDAEAHRNKLAIEQKKAEIQSKIDELNKQLEELK